MEKTFPPRIAGFGIRLFKYRFDFKKASNLIFDTQKSSKWIKTILSSSKPVSELVWDIFFDFYDVVKIVIFAIFH